MTKPKWYSPQLARETVRRLYLKAKAERIPMTRLANRLMEKALDTEQMAECRRDTDADTASSESRSAPAACPWTERRKP